MGRWAVVALSVRPIVSGALIATLGWRTMFFASQHYANVRSAAQDEASEVAEVVDMSGAFPASAESSINRQLYCYVTEVIDDEWRLMRDGDDTGSPKVDGRLRAVYAELLRVGRPSPPELST